MKQLGKGTQSGSLGLSLSPPIRYRLGFPENSYKEEDDSACRVEACRVPMVGAEIGKCVPCLYGDFVHPIGHCLIEI